MNYEVERIVAMDRFRKLLDRHVGAKYDDHMKGSKLPEEWPDIRKVVAETEFDLVEWIENLIAKAYPDKGE